jgi:hypothetical protein
VNTEVTQEYKQLLLFRKNKGGEVRVDWTFGGDDSKWYPATDFPKGAVAALKKRLAKEESEKLKQKTMENKKKTSKGKQQKKTPVRKATKKSKQISVPPPSPPSPPESAVSALTVVGTPASLLREQLAAVREQVRDLKRKASNENSVKQRRKLDAANVEADVDIEYEPRTALRPPSFNLTAIDAAAGRRHMEAIAHGDQRSSNLLVTLATSHQQQMSMSQQQHQQSMEQQRTASQAAAAQANTLLIALLGARK